MDIVWHRNDIRISDNIAVSNSNNSIPVYVFDTRILEFASDRRIKWIVKNMKKLKSLYRSEGSDLAIRVGESPAILRDLIEEFNVDRVLWNKSYTKLGRSRDKHVKEIVESKDLEYDVFDDRVLHEPSSIFTNKGDPYSVFTYYHKKWDKRKKDSPQDKPRALHKFSDYREVPRLEELGFKQPNIDLPKPGTEAARDALDKFIKTSIDEYQNQRDYPSQRATSRLSPYLSYGIIGIREVWERTEEAKNSANEESVIESIEEFQQQLAWRDFYNQVIYHNPELVNSNYKNYENQIEWKNDEKKLLKWKEGKTGYPIVDAGMRQLKKEGWMHNRVRMIVASFLTKDLLIDWRKGYEWFRKMLIDHNTANDNGGWQWAASTGTDAQPYFRIFNPMTQGEDYDPEAEYIKNFIPELQEVEPDTIHNWNELSEEDRTDLAPEYFNPIVDHSKKRKEAMQMYKKARGDTDQ